MFVVGAAREHAFDHVLDHVVVELGEPILPELGNDPVLDDLSVADPRGGVVGPAEAGADQAVVELLEPDLPELVHGHWRRGAAHAAAEVDLGVLGPVLCGGRGGEWRAFEQPSVLARPGGAA